MVHALRSPLVAGVVAAVGAVALVSAPAGNTDRLLAALAPPSTAQLTLSALSNPIEQLLASGEIGENYLLGAYYNGRDTPTPGAGEANWPSAGFDQFGGDLLNWLLTNQAALGNYTYVGLLPNFAAEAYLLAVQQLQINVEDYLSVVLSGLNSAASELAAGVWEFPGTIVSAVQLALQGQLAQALSVIVEAVAGPLVAAGQDVLDAATYVVSNVVARAGAVVAALPQILTTFAGTALGGVSVLAQKTIAIVTGVVTSLTTLNFEGAWNTAVEGLLGPSGIPGALLNLTTGAGVQTGPILDPADIPANFVPSVRTSFQAAQWAIRDALQTDAECGCGEAGKRAAAAPAVADSSAAGGSPSPADAVDTTDTADTTDTTVAAPASGHAASGRADRTRDHARRAAAERARG